MDAAGMAVGSRPTLPGAAAGQAIASVEGAPKSEFATLLEDRAIGAIGDMILDLLKPPW
jgi:hypothetical protein